MKSWHDNVFFGIHYDLHANPSDTNLGAELSAEHLRERLKLVKPDWIQCDCKGHPGWTSWPTKTGSPAPHIINDALKIHRKVTKELGIRLGMHYSGVWDDRAIALHPEWARINEKGERDAHMTSRLGGYDQGLMIPQLIELIDTYKVDGFWIDGENWASKPDWSPACQAEFSRRTGLHEIPLKPGDPHWEAWIRFHRDLFVEHVAGVADAVHARNQSCTVCSNWMYTVRQPDPIAAGVDYLSGDFDWAWGANRAAVEGRLLDARGMSWDLMAWGFTKSHGMGDDPPWVFKPSIQLKQEIAEVIALGGAVMIYDQPQRSGWITGWHQQTLAEVARWARARKKHCFKTQTASEVAVLHLLSHNIEWNVQNGQLSAGPFSGSLFDSGGSCQPLEGALHAMLENHRSTDVLTEDAALARISGYKLIVVPEQLVLTDAMEAALQNYARAGGWVLISGSHLATEYPQMVGVAPSHLPTDKALAYVESKGRTTPVSGPWAAPTLLEGTETWAYQLKQQEPEKDRTDKPAVTCRRLGKGAIVAIHGNVFRDYFLGHYPILRDFLGEVVGRMKIAWTIRAKASHRLEIISRKQGKKLLINLVNRGAGEALSAKRTIVEELLPIDDIELQIRTEKKPKRVEIHGEKSPMRWSFVKGLTTIRLPKVEIHTVISVE